MMSQSLPYRRTAFPRREPLKRESAFLARPGSSLAGREVRCGTLRRLWRMSVMPPITDIAFAVFWPVVALLQMRGGRSRSAPSRFFSSNRRGLRVDFATGRGVGRTQSVGVRSKRGGTLEVCREIRRKTAMHLACNLIGQDLTFPAFEGVERRPHDFHRRRLRRVDIARKVSVDEACMQSDDLGGLLGKLDAQAVGQRPRG